MSKKSSEKSLKQSKFKEIPMGSDLIDEIFDSSKRIGFETEEERDLREKKEDYNKTIIKLIKKLDFTARQLEIFELMYVKGMTLTEVSKHLGIRVQAVDTTRNLIFKKIKNKINYNFKYCENPQFN